MPPILDLFFFLSFFFLSSSVVLKLLYGTPRLPQRYSCPWVIVKIGVLWGKMVESSFDDILLDKSTFYELRDIKDQWFSHSY